MSPVFDAGKPVATGNGWGCSCPSFRFGEPDPATALSRLGGSANVTVEFKGKDADGLHFVTWTDPENQYQLTYGPGKVGWCKHAIGCMVHFLPWHRQLALGAADALEEIKQLRKENRKLERENRKLRS